MPTKIALITGAAQGIGHAIAIRLADDGLDIAVNDIAKQNDALNDLVKIIESKGRRSIAVVADVSVENDVKAMISTVVETLGGLDVMVANAGILRNNGLLCTSCEEWDLVQSINARGVFLSYKYAAEQMLRQGRGGRIIGACSMAGKKGITMNIAYTASKFAVRGLTQSAAQELGKSGITVNAYAPGPVDTPMTQTATKAMDKEITKQTGAPSDVKSTMLALSSVGKIATAQDVAGLVSFIASPASDLINGQTISIDGGINFD